MGLGLPAALLGLLALGIPLWLHRMRRRVEREQRLPTLALLVRAQAEDKKPARFHDLPLLIARLCVLACLTLALAQPHLFTEDPVVGDEPVALVCVIDDSLSMQRVDGGSTLLKQARERAHAVVAGLPPGSEVSVVLAGTPARLLHVRDTQLDLALDALSALSAEGARGTDLESALALAHAQLGGTALDDQRVWLLTDCTTSSSVAALAQAETALWVQCLGDEAPQDNAYIDSLSLAPHPSDAERLSLRVEVRSTRQQGEVPVEVRVDDETLAKGRVTLREHAGSIDLELDPRSARKARHATVRLLVDDALPEDDSMPLSGALSEGPSVLLVDGAPSLQRMDDELRLLNLALSAPGPEGQTFSVRRTDYEGLGDADLEHADVIILANVPAPGTRLVERIARRVEAGGGLWVGVGDMADPFAYRGDLAELLPASPRGSADAAPPLTIAQAEPSAALPLGSAGLSRAGTSRRWLLEDSPPDAHTVLRFEDGTAALILRPRGSGQVALWTTSFDDDWSDAPLTPGFVALVHSMVRFLSPDAEARRRPVLAGSPVPLSDDGDVEAFEVVLPTGERLELAPHDGHATLTRTEHVGAYRVRARRSDGSHTSDRLQLQVRVDPAESQLAATSLGGDMRPGGAKATGTRRGRRPVSPWIWLLLGMFALGEAALRVVRRTPRGLRLAARQG